MSRAYPAKAPASKRTVIQLRLYEMKPAMNRAEAPEASGPFAAGDLQDATQRDVQPGGAIVQLVADLVDRFFQQERVEQQTDRLQLRGEKARARGGLQPGAQEGAAHEGR